MSDWSSMRALELATWLDLGCEPYESHRHRLNEQRAASSQLRAAVEREFELQTVAAALRQQVTSLAAENATLRAENVMGNHCRRDYPVLEAELRLARDVIVAARGLVDVLGDRVHKLLNANEGYWRGRSMMAIRDYDAHVAGTAGEGETHRHNHITDGVDAQGCYSECGECHERWRP